MATSRAGEIKRQLNDPLDSYYMTPQERARLREELREIEAEYADYRMDQDLDARMMRDEKA